MAQIKGTNVGSPVVPFDTADANPSHEAKYGKGGYRTAATTAERDAIPAARREAGMLVFVAEDETIYQLGADLATWTEFSSGATYDQSLNTTDDVTFESVSLPNGTQITVGTFDNLTGGSQNGISLHCAVGYELNWQGGHIQSTSDGGVTAATIWCDSPIQFPGGGAASVQIDATGLTFADGIQQRVAGVASAHSHAVSEVVYPTALLLHFDGTDGDTTFTDSSPNGLAVSRIGSAAISTTQSRFGGSSLAFGLGDGVSVAADPALHVGAGDFTVEFWGYLTAGSILASQRGSGGYAWTIASNAVYWNYYSMGFPQVSFFAWHHYALVRHAGFLRLYVDGAEVCSSEIGNAVIGPSTDYIGIGRDAEGNVSAGWIDEFRMVIGTAIYRAPFIPPTAPHGLGLELATVATSGSYDDLVDLPTLFSGDYGDLTNAPTLGAVATSNEYADLNNLPTLGSAAASDTTDFAAATHSHAWSDLTSGVPTTISGYGITDAVASDDSRLSDNRSPTAHKTSHATGGSDAISAADIGAAAASHTHSWSDITSGVPSAFTPSSHKTSHATGGSDALTASDIGAAAATHTHDDRYYTETETDTLLAGKVGTSDARLTDARTPLSHVHGNITNTGAIGTTSGQIVVTTTSGVLTTAASISAGSVSGLATSATTDTTNASNISSGTLGSARLPLATTGAAGAVVVGSGLSVSSGTVSANVTSVDGSTGTVTVTKSEVFTFTRTTKPASASGSSGSYTWTIPATAKVIEIAGVGGGGGGGSGCRGAAGSNRGGGGGGGAGGAMSSRVLVSDLASSSLAINIGAGGGGGSAASADGDGSPGSPGGPTYVTASGTYIVDCCGGGGGGSGKSTAAGSGGTGQNDSYVPGLANAGGAGGYSGGPPAGNYNATTNTNAGAAGGSGGGGINSANTAGNGGANRGRFGSSSVDVAGGVVPGGAGAAGYTYPSPVGCLCGSGGSGGAGNASGAGGAGGNGASPGGGGGGGGASVSGSASGAGGNGGGGFLRVTVWY